MSNHTIDEERAAYLALTKRILDAYVDLYPNRTWTNLASAIDLMVAEIEVMREELRKERLSLQ